MTAARTLSATLQEEKRFVEARDVLTTELAKVSDAAAIARLYQALGSSFEEEGRKHNAMLMLELSLKHAPADDEVRFDTAYKYADLNDPGMALFHYEKLLERRPNHAAALNNIGLVATQLGMPMAGIGYQRRSEAQGSTLAMANIASTLMRAGFRDEARALIAKAREDGNPDRRVEIVAGNIATAEAQEEQLAQQIKENTAKLRRWRAQEAEALLSTSISADVIAGKYAGTPSELTLTAKSADRLDGEFQRAGSKVNFWGTLNGRVISFSWRVAPTRSYSSYEQSGWGVLIADDGRLKGFSVDKTEAPSGKELPGWTEWQLNAVADSEGPRTEQST